MCSECVLWCGFIVCCVVDSVWLSIWLLNMKCVLMLWFWLWNRLFFSCFRFSRLISFWMCFLCMGCLIGDEVSW